MIVAAIAKLVEQQHLTEEEAAEAMRQIMEGDATPAQIAAFLTALRIKGETVSEITGCARVMREKATHIGAPANVIDTCGTGGDGAQTFNISTTAAFVVAGAGIPVAKHGNRAMSSRCGSADLLQALGVTIELTPELAERCLAEVGMTFLFAPLFHSAMKHAIGPRREIGVRTIFNILGPLTNPAGATRQLIGVSTRGLVEPLAQVLGNLGSSRAFVVHGADGLDEITTAGETHIAALDHGAVATFTIRPEQFGLPRVPLEALAGGDAQQNARITIEILEGKPGPQRDVVLLNAAAALVVAGAAADWHAGLQLAAEAVDSGAALDKLRGLQRFAS
ncbi:MAG TPA: anthranilate phosphoribosyltransferase [Alphaproteobacteria bacterium]|nr:anthranilate phosphoribosyltransferase [Alphaproteobacteria bacterium]